MRLGRASYHPDAQSHLVRSVPVLQRMKKNKEETEQKKAALERNRAAPAIVSPQPSSMRQSPV
jgi:hypothetical protein